jgi:hypothetical protein
VKVLTSRIVKVSIKKYTVLKLDIEDEDSVTETLTRLVKKIKTILVLYITKTLILKVKVILVSYIVKTPIYKKKATPSKAR